MIRFVALAMLILPSEALAQVACSARPGGEEVFIDCADGSHFEAPAGGGMAYGFDRRGNDLDAGVTLSNGRYSVEVLPPR